MEKQTVYIPVDVNERNPINDGFYYTEHTTGESGNNWFLKDKWVDEIITGKPSTVSAWLEKKENVYVFTPQEFEKAIGDAFDAGKNSGVCLYPTPNKTEYFNNLKP